MSVDWVAKPGHPLRGSLRLPGDKSVSHRALMLGAIAEGDTRIEGFLEGSDTLATARILGQLGVRIEAPSAGVRLVQGVGLHGLRASRDDLDCGNAGTGMRLLTGLLAGQGFESRLVGDASLSRRPMARVIEPLERMGARIESGEGRVPPLRIHSNNSLQAIDFEAPIPSAQVKSAILLAGLYAAGVTTVREPQPTRDYTERMLAAFGYPIGFEPGWARLEGGHCLRGTTVAVPADFSSAAFFLVAASLLPGSDLVLPAVGINPRRTGLLEALRRMGADIELGDTRETAGEPVADLRVRHAPLRGIELPAAIAPDMIDEFPILFVAAALAEGESRFDGLAELRVKESDRLEGMAQALAQLGARVETGPDWVRIQGGPLSAGTVDSRGDHRLAMALAVAAQRAAGPIRILDCANVETSFPGFARLAAGAGLGLELA
jgi:3-phosphoshikimate 1-carboxyvinyltransferase